jgi:hypothetical protein
MPAAILKIAAGSFFYHSILILSVGFRVVLVGCRRPARRSFHNHCDFSFRRPISHPLQQLLQSAALEFLKLLGQLAGQDRAAVAKTFQERGQQLLDAMRAFEEDQRPVRMSKIGNAFRTRPGFAG